MKAINRFKTSKNPKYSLRPDFISKSIATINFKYLRSIGITNCFIDLDGTVVSRGTFEVDASISDALKSCGLIIHIATNRPKSRSLKTLKEDLHATSVIHPKGFFGKPTKQYYKNALKDLNLNPNEVVMIGDRYIQDIFGANLAGIYSLVVFKLGLNKNRVDKFISDFEKKRTEHLYANYQEVK